MKYDTTHALRQMLVMLILPFFFMSCADGGVSTDGDPVEIIIQFNLNDSETGLPLFFGTEKMFDIDSLEFVPEAGGNISFLHADGHFQLSGLYPNPNETYRFELVYQDDLIGVLSLEFDESIIQRNPEEFVNAGSILLFEQQVICKNCHALTIYPISLNL